MHVVKRLHKFNYRSLKKQNELRKKKRHYTKKNKNNRFHVRNCSSGQSSAISLKPEF